MQVPHSVRPFYPRGLNPHRGYFNFTDLIPLKTTKKFSFRAFKSFIIRFAMQIYVELALAENFCMDFTLLYCAKLICKNPAHILRVITASVYGACFAVVFPLLNSGGATAALIKIISGLIICLLGGKFKSFKAYFKMTAVFFGFTFVLGGALIAVFAICGWEYGGGSGYIISSAPIGIPLFGGLILIIFARKLAARLKRTDKTVVECKIFLGEKSVKLSGFFDSGNKVYRSGMPVSVIPLVKASEIIDAAGIKDSVKIHTVAGSKKIKVFKADKIEIYRGDRTDAVEGVIIGISPRASGGAVLHPDLLEE